jgi:TRAP-type C4-dicarboxylate transport system substrate-binding protein
MKMGLKKWSLALASVLSVSLLPAAHAQEVTLKAVSAFPENTIDSKMFEDWIRKVNEAGKGSIQIRYLGGPKAVPTFEVGNAVKTGVVDLALASGSFYTNVIPEADFLKLAQVSIQEQRKNGGWAYINEVWKQKANLYYLARFKEYTPVHLYLNKNIDKPDLTGLKIRVTPLYRDFFQTLGASVVTIAPGEVYTALERNVVDGYGWTVHGLFDLNWNAQTKYRVDPGFYSAEVGIILNHTTWSKLTPAQQKLLHEHGVAHEAKNEQFWNKYNADDTRRQAESGIKTITFSDRDRSEYLKKAYDAAWTSATTQSPVHGPKLKTFLSKQN